jgi:Acyl-CoA reductase (LuxC)./Acyl-protein synthetase, LuxE.
MGLNYPDCKCGCKHTSSFSRVVVRDIETREILEDGKEGMLEFITPIPHSYPGNAVLTDDIGVIIPGKCPYGRLGTRFKVIGRIKKAEIRGCGDILSSKLTFQETSKEEKDIFDNNLEICLYKGNISSNESNEQLGEIVNYLKAKQKWLINQPVDAIIGLISQVAQTWPNNVSLLGLKDKGLLFLSSWCDNKHLKSISELGLRGNIGYIDRFMEFPNSDKHYLKANSRGLVCHWLAGNVQILGFFALIQSIITKNVNLLKISSRDNGVFVNILNTFVDTEYTTESGYLIKGNDLLETIAVVYFSRHAKDLGVKMSMEADVRIAWGGKEAIQTVSNYPAKFDCETVMFGPKLSFAVISKEELSSEQDAKKLARRVAIDTSVFDQTGCASPHNLYVEDGGNISVSRFLEILGEIMPKVELQIPKPITSIEQVSNIHSIRGIYDFKGYVVGSNNMSWTLLFDDKVERCSPIYSRVLFVHKIKSIYETLNLIDDNTQTIGIAAPKEKALDFALLATEKGVSRLPIIGRMLNFEMPWDGIILIDRLVKWNTYGGPLR